jgi:SAM-dependent methyltransferase
MTSYYSEKLSAERLKLCYDLAPPSVQRYLAAEIEHVRKRIRPTYRVLELGCGYGRVLRGLAQAAGMVVGIDTSLDSLRMAMVCLAGLSNIALAHMDAIELAFPAECFDLVCCVQNGISAFHVDQRALLCSAVTVTRPGGKVLFSSYADQFWRDRLEWFRIQASNGLVGEIDEAATGNGTIVCKDGFRATTVRPDGFRQLSQGLGTDVTIEVVAGSSVFCEISV